MKQEINQLLDWRMNPELAHLPVVCAEQQRTGMRHFASGVSVVTSRFGETRVGLTATAVCSVTVDPPRMLVLVNKKAFASEVILAGGVVCINVLSQGQEHIAKVFAGMIEGVSGPGRFEHGHWNTLVSGAPVLNGALANFDCRVIKVFDESTHHAFLCEVLANGENAGGEPLVYINGTFRHIAPQTSQHME